MKSKTFAILVICIFIASTFILAGSLYLSSKILTDKSYDWKNGRLHEMEPLLREEKSMYIGQKDISFNAYVLGGSKAGFLQKDKLDYYSGRNFYNFFSTAGGFRDYELYAEFLTERHGDKIKEIFLHLSTYETECFANGDYIPVAMQKNFLGKCKSIYKKITKLYLNIELIISYIYKKMNNADYVITKNGEYEKKKSLADFQKNPEEYIRKNVTKINSDNRDIKELFFNSSRVKKSVCKKNIRALKNIKKLCDQYGIELKLVIGAHYINRLANIWGDDFDNYLKDLIAVNGKLWNFCGINDVNMNPYNFFNDGHFWFFVGDKMIETIYSETPNASDMDAFGILLTKDNIDSYIASQKEKWQQLKNEYEATGTIKLYDMNHPSYLGSKGEK